MLLSVVLQIVIFPLPNLYWLSWIAVAPLVLAILRARRSEALQIEGQERLLAASLWQGFLLSYGCGILWFAGTCYWVFDTMHRFGGLPMPVAFLVLVAFCMFVGIYHGLFGLLLALAARHSDRMALMVSPVLWVALELARTRITAFPWGLLGYAQADNGMLTRIAPLTGVYGLSFEIMLVNSVFAAAFLVPKDKRRWLLASAIGAAVVLQSGQLVQAPLQPVDRTALLVQPNIPVQEVNWTADYFQGTVRDLTRLTMHPPGTAGERRFDLVVWPESPSPFFLNDATFRELAGSVAMQSGTWFLVGSIGNDVTAKDGQHKTEDYNSAGLFSPSGQLTSRYDKVHLVPFGEYVPFRELFPFMDMLTQQVGTFARGRSRAPLEAGSQRLGVFICYESIFPDEVRQFARNGADVLVNVSNDGWYGDSGAWKQHMQMARLRAIENRRWLLLGTNTGISASVDPFGRVVAGTGRQVRTALGVPYASLTSTTFYTRHGDWFAYLCAIISTGLLAFVASRKR